jgi:60 kDa SS-A/Ro ribonucleoprotein
MKSYVGRLASALPRANTTPQTEVIPGREADMVANAAGGVSFKVNEWDQLDRFLILGSEGGTYYATERDITKQNLSHIQALIAKDGKRVVARVAEISESGRAPKNDPALLVLALASAADAEGTRKAALDALPRVARIGTHLFHYAEFVKNLRGWGRSLRRAIANWYLEQPVDRLAIQAIKYQQRDGWSHADLLRLSHPQADEPERDAVFRWILGGEAALRSTERTVTKGDQKLSVIRPDLSEHLHVQIQAFEKAKRATSADEIVRLIIDFDLPREAIPTQYLNDVKVWEALMVKMPMTAMIRNLATMTRVGLLTNLSEASKTVKSRLNDEALLKKARVHPIAVLSALLTYQSGRSVRGSSTWTPVRSIVDALDTGFYKSFGAVTPTGKPTLLALDVSGSMGMGDIAGIPGLTPRIGSAAMALITANVEESYEFIGFTGGSGYYGRGGSSTKDVTVLNISPNQRLDDVIRTISGLPFGGTDCALPMKWAQENAPVVENFSVYTDNETWGGSQHPSQALKEYRQKTGLPAKLAVIGMTATDSTIADPKDSGMMDVVGFDTSAPQLISDFFSK